MTTITKRNYRTNETLNRTNETLTRNVSTFVYVDKDGFCLQSATITLSAQEVVDIFESRNIPSLWIDTALKLDQCEKFEVWSMLVSERMLNNLIEMSTEYKSENSSDSRFTEFQNHMEKYAMFVLSVDKDTIEFVDETSFKLVATSSLKEAA